MFARARRGNAWSSRAGRERLIALAVLGVTIVLFAVTAAVRGPSVARTISHRLDLRRVEGHAELLRRVANEARVDPCLLAGIMYVESRGQLDAVSPRGALGLFQLMPSAAEDAAKRMRLPPPTRDDLLADGELNARLAANHLMWLVRHEGPDLERVLVAYNAGRSKMRGWAKDAGGFDAWREEQSRAGSSGALRYAQDVIELMERFRARGAIVPAPTLGGVASAARG